MLLGPDASAAEIERMLKLLARQRFGSERAAELDARIERYAGILTRIAREPISFADDPPEISGISEQDDRD